MIGSRLTALHLDTYVLNKKNADSLSRIIEALTNFARYYISCMLKNNISKEHDIYELQEKYKEYFIEAKAIFYHLLDDYIHWPDYSIDSMIDAFAKETKLLDWKFTKDNIRIFVENTANDMFDKNIEILTRLKKEILLKKLP